MGEGKGAWLFLITSLLTVNRQASSTFFDELLLGRREPETDSDTSEEGDLSSDEISGRLPRVGSEYSLGLNRVKSVDDMIKNFDWEVCSSGQRVLHGLRITVYSLVGTLILAKVLSAGQSQKLKSSSSPSTPHSFPSSSSGPLDTTISLSSSPSSSSPS